MFFLDVSLDFCIAYLVGACNRVQTLSVAPGVTFSGMSKGKVLSNDVISPCTRCYDGLSGNPYFIVLGVIRQPIHIAGIFRFNLAKSSAFVFSEVDVCHLWQNVETLFGFYRGCEHFHCRFACSLVFRILGQPLHIARISLQNFWYGLALCTCQSLKCTRH